MLSRLPRQAYNKPLLKVFSRTRDSSILPPDFEESPNCA